MAFKVPPPPGSFFEAVEAAFARCNCGKCDGAKVDCPHADDEPSSQHARRMTAHEPDCSCQILCECIWPEELAAAGTYTGSTILGKTLQKGISLTPPLGVGLVPGLSGMKPVPDAAPPSDDVYEMPSPVTMPPKRPPRRSGPQTDHTSPRAAFRTGGR